MSGIGFSVASNPKFAPFENGRRTPKRRSVSQQSILDVVKKYAAQVGIQVDRAGRCLVQTHSDTLRSANHGLAAN
ncbi:hypothetical protein CA13_62600 [Planctomycetes bacterium CA13]|uniref:Uncharacterized protein n=2 Tax=Novipirellula herctigrandis TaxID=2527986 RepID=A0A5C5ZCA4_9BACT|nr:hypothetical protein CA13_62600 [Planctomycetes bacterium CA13]